MSGRNGDHELLRMTNAFILCDLVWKIQKSYAANRESSFNFGALNWFDSSIKKLQKSIRLYQPYGLHLCHICVQTYRNVIMVLIYGLTKVEKL